MNPRQRINALLAHWATFPIGINDRGVAVAGKYHGHMVCEHGDGSFNKLAKTDLRLKRIGEQSSNKRSFSGHAVVSRQGDGLALPMSTPRLHDSLGDNAG